MLMTPMMRVRRPISRERVRSFQQPTVRVKEIIQSMQNGSSVVDGLRATPFIL